MKGRFVVFEGIDGSGKGTLIHILKNYLIGKGYSGSEILVTREPSSGKLGKKIRELLKKETDPKANAAAFLDLYLRDRKEHLEKEIVPALEAGKIVLCDRYKYSTIVYQSLQGIPVETILGLHEGMPLPELVIVLDLPVKTAIGRISADGKRAGKEKFEQETFLKKVKAGFKKLPELLPDESIIVLDASKPIEKVAERAKEELNKLIVVE